MRFVDVHARNPLRFYRYDKASRNPQINYDYYYGGGVHAEGKECVFVCRRKSVERGKGWKRRKLRPEYCSPGNLFSATYSNTGEREK